MLSVIINADDLGSSPTVNAKIFDLIDRGRISSATLTSGGNSFEDACQKSRDFGSCSFGVHLYLTDFHPLTNSPVFEDCGLIDFSNGAFNGRIRSVRPTPRLKNAIYTEWSAQLKRARDGGLKVSHINSHHHVHTIPWLMGTLAQLARYKQVPAVRRSMDLYYRPEVNPPRSLLIKKAAWNAFLPFLSGVKTARHFTNFSWFLKLLTSREIAGGYDHWGPIELMCHPGNRDYSEETANIDTDWQRYVGTAIKMITYNDL